MKQLTTRFTLASARRLAAGVAISAIAILCTSQAKADIWEDLGLTGGSNSISILEVKTHGKLTFDKDDFEGGFEPVSGFTGPTVKAEMKCKRSGYRCSKLGDSALDSKHSEVTKEVAASLAKSDAAKTKIDAACKAKKKTVELDVTVPGTCHKSVFPTIGPKNIKVSSPAKTATFDLTCASYDE